MKMKIVKSSNIAKVGYNKDEGLLHVEFKHGGVYEYTAVPKNVLEGIEGASSIGSYLHKNVFKKELKIPYKKLPANVRHG